MVSRYISKTAGVQCEENVLLLLKVVVYSQGGVNGRDEKDRRIIEYLQLEGTPKGH